MMTASALGIALMVAQASLPHQVQIVRTDTTPAAEWAFDEDTDRVTDQHGAIASVISVDGKGLLAIQCDPATDGNPFLLQLRLGGTRAFNQWFEVTLRPDGARPVTGQWYRVTDAGIVADQGEIRKLLRLLGATQRIYVRALDHEGQAVDREFLLGKPASVFARVLKACGRPDFLAKR